MPDPKNIDIALYFDPTIHVHVISLPRLYLEELGTGVPASNYPCICKRLHEYGLLKNESL